MCVCGIEKNPNPIWNKEAQKTYPMFHKKQKDLLVLHDRGIPGLLTQEVKNRLNEAVHEKFRGGFLKGVRKNSDTIKRRY